MSEQIMAIEVEARAGTGKGASRAARRAGLTPGVIYGSKEAPVSINISPKILWAELNKSGFFTRLYDLKVAGKVERVLPRAVQMHPVTDRPLHVDFMRVSADARIHVKVPLVFDNEAVSPGIKKGGVLNAVHHELEIICSPTNIPHAIHIDMKEMDIGHSVHVRDLKLPEGVKAVEAAQSTVMSIAPPTVSGKEG